MPLSKEDLKTILTAQEFELSEHVIYTNLARLAKPENRKVLTKLATDSLEHNRYWGKITGKVVSANKFKIWFYTLVTRVFGLTFGVKLMEQSEKEAQKLYEKIVKIDKKYTWIINEERRHEKDVIGLIDDDFLKYIGSIVLGSSDALVELTGTLAGLTLALKNTQLIGATGLIVGIAASLSMASSEYLSTKSEAGAKKPFRAAIFTGITYVLTVIFLIFPYFLVQNYFISLGLTLFCGSIVILVFAFYLSVSQDIPFKKRFLENLTLSFGVAFLSFIIGFLVKKFLNIDV